MLNVNNLIARSKECSTIDISELSDDLEPHWKTAEEQWKLLSSLVSEYINTVGRCHDSQPSDQLHIDLCEAIGKLADKYNPLQRSLYESSNMTEQLQSYNVFLSHTGKQKQGYVDYLYQKFPQGSGVFFDIKSLKAGDDAKDQMRYAALTCKVAIVVLTRDFLAKKWPILELSLFAARLREKKRLSRYSKNKELSAQEISDLEFTLLLDFYSQDEKSDWTNEVLNIPNFLIEDFPTGIVHYEPLDSLHAIHVIESTLQKLDSSNWKV